VAEQADSESCEALREGCVIEMALPAYQDVGRSVDEVRDCVVVNAAIYFDTKILGARLRGLR